MLQPSNRLTLLDAMRPPEGFGVDAAMAITFTLDLRALLAAPAAFVLGTRESVVDDGTQQEPIELLHALRAHAEKLTVMSHVGEIALPPSRGVFAFLERAVVPVRAPLGGVVHPKVWVLRYRSHDAQRLRVLVASRNLTFDASWDTIVRLDEADNGAGDLGAVGELFEGLIPHAVADPGSVHADRVAGLAADLRRVRFALPRGVDDLSVVVLGLRRGPSPLPSDTERSLLISPFVGDDFFARVRPSPLDALVSRPEQLDQLGHRSLAAVRSLYAFDDGSATDFAADGDRRSPRDPGRPLVGLHAKVFAFEDGGRARVFLGSANATGEAFGRNVEMLLELTGSVAHLGIDRLCEGSGDELGFEALLVPYRSDPDGADEDAGPDALDQARRAIAGLAIDGRVEPDDGGWAVTYRSAAELPVVEGTTITCWPLAAPGSRRVVPGGRLLEERFGASLETVSGFLAFEVRHDDGGLTQFVVPAALDGVPEERDRALLRSLIGDGERFLRYLLALLADDSSRMELLDALEVPGADGAGDRETGETLPVLEQLLRTVRRDPSRLLALDPLVTDLAADEALPPGFEEMWCALCAVAVDAEGAR